MSWRKETRSHKTRLALVATLAGALVLALVFVLTLVVAKRSMLAEEREEVEGAYQRVTTLPDALLNQRDLEENVPILSVRIFDRQGRVVASKGTWPVTKTPRVGVTEMGDWLILAGDEEGKRIAVGHDLEEIQEGIGRMGSILLVLWIPLSLFLGGATWLAANAVFRPLNQVIQSATAIEGTDLSRRLPVPDRAEFGHLAAVLNRMLERIEESSLRSERFAADAAHELRTPLAIMRVQIETILLRLREPEEYVESYRATLTEIERLSTLCEALLRSARGTVDDASAIDLKPIVERVCGRVGEDSIRPLLANVWAKILPEEMELVVTNLLENAVRFSPAGSEVEVSLGKESGQAELKVRDHGQGICAEDRDRVFERLFRSDSSRSRDSGGFGIGLALCQRVILQRGGEVLLEETPGGGATFVVRLPLV